MNDMELPEGKTCGDCIHWIRCNGLFMCKPEEVVCDFAPSRFVDCNKENDDEHN